MNLADLFERRKKVKQPEPARPTELSPANTPVQTGASGNTANVIALRKLYNNYIENGGTMTFEEFAASFGTNANPYRNTP